MKVVISTLAALFIAAPQYSYASPLPEKPSTSPAQNGAQGATIENSRTLDSEESSILRDIRDQKEDGTFNFEFEGDNGIVVSGSGSPSGENGTIVHAGSYKYTAPDGTVVEVTYVADEKGFQPESESLPVATVPLHPIPQFALDQIAKAEAEKAAT